MPDVRFHSVFDIIGPVMVGPSSSHTAGAARIGKVVRDIFGETPETITIFLCQNLSRSWYRCGASSRAVGDGT